MAVLLPVLPILADLTPRLVSFGGDLTPPLGGPVQRIRRLGSRYAIDVSLPPLGGCAGDWIGAVAAAEAENDTLRLRIPQVKGTAAIAPTVVGDGQTGTVLNVTGLAAAIGANTFFSFESGGRAYLHMVTRAVGAGAAQLTISPMLRASPANGAALAFVEPILEGFVSGTAAQWKIAMKRFRTFGFSIQENR